MGEAINLADHERCHGFTSEWSKNPGGPCPAKIHPLAEEDGLNLCYAHWQNQLSLDDPRRKLRAGPGRPRLERPSEVLQRMVDERVEEIVSVFFDAIEATDVTVVKNADGMEIVETPNHQIRMRAADSLLDRAYGKAVQRSESTNINVGIEARTEGELEALAEAMRSARELEPAEDEEFIEGSAIETTEREA